MILIAAVAFAWELRGPDGIAGGKMIDAGTVFAADTQLPPNARVLTDPAALGRQAHAVLRYLDAHGSGDSAVGTGIFAELGATPNQTRATLEFIAKTADDNPASLRDPEWLLAHFARSTWKTSRESGKVRITRYLISQTEGSASPTADFNQALWSDPGQPWRTRYTRREVMEGAYLSGEGVGHSEPLVWLREASVHDALMQGTVAVTTGDGKTQTFSVDVANGRDYEKGKKGRDQARFWYFRRGDGPRGWGIDPADRIPLEAGVAVAGDVYNLGVGRAFLIEAPRADGGTDLRVAILADTGGAFQPNLGQLDWFAGAFPSHEAMYAAWKDLPDEARVDVLLARP